MSTRLGLASRPGVHVAVDRSACPRWLAGRKEGKAHGTESAYCLGCRCDDARDARRLRVKRRREKRAVPNQVDPLPAVRRLRALAAIGWSLDDIVEAGGFENASALKRIRGGYAKWAYRTTDEKVRVAYTTLAHRPGPSERSRRWALKFGWASPLAWVDIDDPSERPSRGCTKERDDRPDENVADALLAGRVKWGEVRLLDRHLAAYMLMQRMDSTEAGRRLGVDHDTIGKAAKKWQASLADAA